MSPTHYLHNPSRKSVAMCYPQPNDQMLVVWTKWVKQPDPNPPRKPGDDPRKRKPYFCGREEVSASFSFSTEAFQAEHTRYGVSEADYGNAWALYGREM